jgi:VWFA-related protein
MKICTAIILTFALAIGAPLASFGQTSSAPGQGEGALTLGTSEVALDVVVRDKKGRPVKDLALADFEVYEDGVRQDVASFRLVSRAEAREPVPGEAPEAGGPATPAAPAAPGDALPTINTIALVFDRLSADARVRAREAAATFVRENVSGDDFVGVFVTDLSLQVIQPYTSNRDLVLRSVDRAGDHAGSLYASTSEQVRGTSERQAALERQTGAAEATAAAGGAAAGAAGAEIAQNAADQMANEMTMRSLETFEMLERDQQGYATTNGLLSIVGSLRRLPGRKAIVFFSEGIAIPPTVMTHFRAVISDANRANVSVYTVDAAGLRAESLTAETAKEMASQANRRMRALGTNREGMGPPMMRALERNEDLMRLNPQSGLGQLAAETGGFLIANTNNIGGKLRQVDEDLRTHYVLTYAPKNQEYDGQFRQISMKLRRPDVEIQTRKGYYAVANVGNFPILPYEAPALGALAKGSASFPVRAVGLSFPDAGRIKTAPVMVEVPARSFTFSADDAKKTFATDFSIVVLIKNDTQQVIEKLSQNYRLSGPLDKLEETRKGEILFYREVRLEPGRYWLDVVAYDAPSKHASVQRATLVVARDDAKLRLSSLLVIKRAERLTPEHEKVAIPLHYGDTLVYPNLGEPVSKSTAKQLPFCVTVYPAPGTGAPKLTIEVLQKGRTLGQIPAELPPPDAKGRIQFVNALPLASLEPGAYELKLTATDGQTSASRSARFTVAP